MSDSLSAFGRPCPDTLPVIDGRSVPPPVVRFQDIALDFAGFAQAVDDAVQKLHGENEPKPRHVAWAVLRYAPEQYATYSEIGRIVRRDHTSVIHGVKRVVFRAHDKPEFARTIGAIGRSLERDGWNVADIRERMARDFPFLSAQKKTAALSGRRKLKIAQTYRKGVGVADLAAMFNHSRGTIKTVLMEQNVTMRTNAQASRTGKLRKRAAKLRGRA